jgi:hypothetical protein
VGVVRLAAKQADTNLTNFIPPYNSPKMFKNLFNDSDKTINPVHVIAIALTTASIAWVSWLVYKNSALPDLTGVAWLLGGSGAANVAHKAEDILEKFKNAN